jgi:hypothetical protein
MSPRTTGLLWALLSVLTLGALLLVSVPVALLHPFHPQSAWGVTLAYALRRVAPNATLVALAVALALAPILLRRLHRRWRWAPLGLLVALTAASAWFARQNHFEWMFQPIALPAYAAVKDASWVAASDMVIAVEIGGEAAAYPVRLMAFHHLVNTTIGGRPVVSTY